MIGASGMDSNKCPALLQVRVGQRAVRRQVRPNTVIPAEAGIQASDSQPAPLDSGLRRNDDY